MLPDGVGAGAGGGGGVGARVARVPDVGGVGGHGGSAAGGGDDAADAEPSSAVPVRVTGLSAALAGGEAGAHRGAGRGGRALVVRELHDREQRERLYKETNKQRLSIFG